MLLIYLSLYLVCETNCNVDIDVDSEFNVLKLTSEFMTDNSKLTKPEPANINKFQVMHPLQINVGSTIIQKTVTSNVTHFPTARTANKQIENTRAVTKESLQMSPLKGLINLSNIETTIPASTAGTYIIGLRKIGRQTILKHLWPKIVSNKEEKYLTAVRIKKTAIDKTIANTSTITNTPFTGARRKKEDSPEITVINSSEGSDDAHTNSSHTPKIVTPWKKSNINKLLCFWRIIYIACFVVSVILLTCMFSVTAYKINSRCVKIVRFKGVQISNELPSKQKPKQYFL